MCGKFYLYYWPIITTLWFILTFLVSYLVSVLDDHVYPFLPYISDTGAKPPESCIFGQMLNIGALLMLITMCIRYRVAQLCKHKNDNTYKLMNNWSNLFGMLSCIGMSLVANFQETTVVVVHFIGAFMAFGIGAVYCLIHAYLTYLTNVSKLLKCLRIFLSLLFIPLYIIVTVTSNIAFSQFDGENQFQWSKENSGYKMHLVGTFSEWAIALLMILYILTFTVEFKLVKLDEISFELRNKYVSG